MTRKATEAWQDMLAKIQGAWPGKKIMYDGIPTREQAEAMRQMAFNVVKTIKPAAKINTWVWDRGDSFTLEIQKRRKNQ